MQKKIEASHMFMHAHSHTRDCARATEGGERTINNNNAYIYISNLSIYHIYISNLSIYLSIYLSINVQTHTQRERERGRKWGEGWAERPRRDACIHLGVLRLSERDSSFSFPASSLHSPSFQSAGSPVQIVMSMIFYDTAILVCV